MATADHDQQMRDYNKILCRLLEADIFLKIHSTNP